jgi:hypothetical protein
MKSSMRSWRVVNFVLSPISGHLSAESALLINSQADPPQYDATGRAAAEAFFQLVVKDSPYRAPRRRPHVRQPARRLHDLNGQSLPPRPGCNPPGALTGAPR